MTKRERIIQPVTFTEEEKYLLEYAKTQGKPFAVFMKDLIRKEIGEPTKLLTREEVMKMIEDHMKQCNISTAINNAAVDMPKNEEDKKEGFGAKGKAAYKNFIRR